MNKQLINLINKLDDYNLPDIKTSILSGVELLIEALNEASELCDNNIKDYLKNKEREKIEIINSIGMDIDNIKIEAELIKANKISNIETNINNKTDNYFKIKLNENTTYTNPFRIEIDNEIHPVSHCKWTELVDIVCDVLSVKEPKKFKEYIEVINRSGKEGFRFVETVSKKNGDTYFIKQIGKYIQRRGAAECLSKELYEMLKYCGYENNHCVYVTKREIKRKNDKNVIKLENTTEIKKIYKTTDHPITYGVGDIVRYFNNINFGNAKIIKIENPYMTIQFNNGYTAKIDVNKDLNKLELVQKCKF